MKLVIINALNTGSTGKIMFSIAESCNNNGFKTYTFSGSRKGATNAVYDNHIFIEDWLSCYFHMKIGAFTGKNELLSTFSTLRLIKTIKEIKPDIINLHVIHGSYLNIKVLFDYLASLSIPIVWTFHDCWAFTGRCPHFMSTECTKWIDGCSKCVYPKNLYPVSYIDNSKKMWELKKKLFSSLNNLTIVTPSKWLSKFVKKSFLCDKPLAVIPNGIDIDIFSPTPSDFKIKHHIENKTIILGVAFSWNNSKGLDVFIELSKRLSDTYAIVLVGTNDMVDRMIPDSIISIHKTHDQKELAEIYSVADIFVDPTREDNLPTVIMESLACGTPVVTFDTGGCSEIIDDTCGIVVAKDDINELVNSIDKIRDTRKFTSQNCIERAKMFSKKKCFEEYVKLFKSLCL